MSLPLKYGKMRGTLVYLKRTKESFQVCVCACLCFEVFVAHLLWFFLSPARGQEVKIHKDDDDSLLLTFNCSSC